MNARELQIANLVNGAKLSRADTVTLSKDGGGAAVAFTIGGVTE